MQKRGRPSLCDKFMAKNNHDKVKSISISIPRKLLDNIEKNVKEGNRSSKICKLLKIGLEASKRDGFTSIYPNPPT